MNSLVKVIAVFAIAFNLAANTSAQTTGTDTAKSDSLTNKEAYSSFAKYSSSNALAFETCAGLSVLNTLRGQVPGMYLGQDITLPLPKMRNSTPMLLIDGLPFLGEFASFYNLNTFDYSDVSVVASGNALTSFGAFGGPGAIILKSKNGKDISDPLIEVTTTPTLILLDDNDSDESTYREILINNNISFAQDLGAADMRVSLTSSLHPNGTAPGESEALSHSLRINTGWDATDRLSFRLTHNNVWGKDQFKVQRESSGLSGTEAHDYTPHSRITGLTMNYQISDIFTLSSRLCSNRIGSNYEYRTPGFDPSLGEVGYYDGESEQQRDHTFLNLMLKGESRPTEAEISWSGYIALQNERFKTKINLSSPFFSFAEESKYKLLSLVSGYGMGYKNILFINADLRPVLNDNVDNNTMELSWSVNSALVFSDAFQWDSDQFFGRLRSSYGSTPVISHYNEDTMPATIGQSYYQMEPFPGKKMMEAGADISLMNHRLSLSATYYRETYGQTIQAIPVPGGVNFESYVLADIGTTHQKGWEFLLTATPMKNQSVSYRTTLSYARSSASVQTEEPIDGLNLFGRYRSPNPSWRSGMMHVLSIKRFSTSILFETEQNSNYMNYDKATKDDRLIILRDVSVGYALVKNGKNLNNLNLSASGRNLWKHRNYEETTSFNLNQPVNKTFTLSLTASF